MPVNPTEEEAAEAVRRFRQGRAALLRRPWYEQPAVAMALAIIAVILAIIGLVLS